MQMDFCMSDIDLDTGNIVIALFALPIALLTLVLITFQQVVTNNYLVFLSLGIVISALISFFTVRKIIKESILLQIAGTAVFTIAYAFFVSIILSAFSQKFNLTLLVLFIVLSVFLLIFPAIEWVTLVKKDEKDAMLPIQNKLEQILEKITRGDFKIVLAIYLGFYAILIPVLYVIVDNISLALMNKTCL